MLGRKSPAKGYRQVIDSVRTLRLEGRDLSVVLIGPDDDGLPVDGPGVVSLGRQPREVVRGALRDCVALCNMSSSESFGIVLLEAWLAGKPVVANRNCAAFQDMAIHEENALLVASEELTAALRRLLDDPLLGPRLAGQGREQVQRFDWESVSRQFVDACVALVSEPSQRFPVSGTQTSPATQELLDFD